MKARVFRLISAALLATGLVFLATTAKADEFLPREIPALKRFAIVAGTANNQCFTAQLVNDDTKRVKPMVLLSSCEFSIENQTQGFFISRPLQDGYQIFFAANPAYCLAMEPQSHMLVISACALDNAMLRQLPQLWDIKSGGLSLRDGGGKKWCLDTRNKQGLSAVFEPFFAACPSIIPDAFILRVNR